jgi:hypothetical protein
MPPEASSIAQSRTPLVNTDRFWASGFTEFTVFYPVNPNLATVRQFRDRYYFRAFVAAC